MATIEELEACERDVRALLKQGGLPEPDEVEHGETCIRVLWHEPKAALVVYVDVPSDWVDEPIDGVDVASTQNWDLPVEQ